MLDCSPQINPPISALDAEIAAASLPSAAQRRWLTETLGIAPLIVVTLAHVSRIAIDRRDTYQPLDGGEPALLIPVRVIDPRSPATALHVEAPVYGDLVDIVALPFRDARRWALRRGAAAWLGACPPQLLSPPPVPIRRSPLAWLQAGATGLCLLTTNRRERQRLLLGLRAIDAETEAHAAELRHLLAEPYEIPPVTTRGKGAGGHHQAPGASARDAAA